MKANEIIQRYWELVEKARLIITAEPFEKAYFDADDELQLRFSEKADNLSIGSVRATGGYDDSAELDFTWAEFPGALLGMTGDQLAAWMVEAIKAKHAAEAQAAAKKAEAAKAHRELQAIQREAQERAALAALKAKYEK